MQMATLEKNTASTDGDQKENMLTPSKVDSHPVCNDTMKFSNLTPVSLSSLSRALIQRHYQSNDKSRLAQTKARLRSSVGVRGSPETNSVTRFMAQQRMKTPEVQRPPSSQCILSPQVATLRWSRDVDRSRYGLRVYACKNPNLNPITEKPPPPPD
ncbi:hypothetical protein KUCAC02_030197 [Chaenocephalus aceratus]|uniref:Uncharacterized protein n=1 Tax=Chaenocephalus aceratus TaxID=36190 RepID=A0ACB9XI16_CHAAC|nr:hypothetical protein KUCAC02_030197 [Chaenocephalus aceratus]